MNNDDKRVILRRFISCLEQPIQGLIKAEENTLTIDTIANRVQQLERAYQINKNPLISTIMKNNKTNKNIFFEKIQEQHRELLASIHSLVAALQIGPKDEKIEKDKPKRNLSGLKNYCLYHMNGTCRVKNCRFIHADEIDIPESVKKLRSSPYP